MPRPKKTVKSTLWNGWDKEIIQLYSVGASNVEIKSLIATKSGSISNDLWDRWIEEEVKFSETIKKGLILSQSWWEKQGRTNLENTKFSPILWYMNMKNRFGWRDNHDDDGDNTKPEIVETIIP